MKKLFLLGVIFVTVFDLNSQTTKEVKKQQKRDRLLMLDTLETKIEDALYVDLTKLPSAQDLALKGSNFPYTDYILGIRDFVSGYLKLKPIATPEELQRVANEGKSDKIVIVLSEIGEFNEKLAAIGNYPFSLRLKFSDDKEFSFKTKIPVNGHTNFRTAVYNTCQFHFPMEIDKK